jgi:hypothetical protein
MNRQTIIIPMERPSGADRLGQPSLLSLIVALVGGLAFLLARLELVGLGIGLFMPALIVFFYLLVRTPALGLYTAVVLGFLLIGIGRYVPGVQVGLGMDAILLTTWLALFIHRFRTETDWSIMRKDIMFWALITFGYAILEIFNPESRSMEAWFSGRSLGFYMFLLIPLTLLLMEDKYKLDRFLLVWGILSLVASIKGIIQVKGWGLDQWEQQWLNEGNYKTHVLFGKLRAFSFLSDAGQFGANQAYSAVVMLITAVATRGWRRKLFFFIVGLVALYGMVISGTRGAISIPFAGFALYFLLRRNKWLLVSGSVILAVIIFFFKFTTIGQGNAEIRRMRTAFDPNDASLQVRINNQKVLKNYLASRPFGGGIGHGGVKAQRFLPNAYLSQIPTDSWYVLIWVEQGIVGLMLHIIMLLYILIRSCYLIMYRIKDPELKLKLSALAAGLFGVMIASYGNAILGQMPTNVLIFISMAVLLNAPAIDRPNKININ